MNENGFNVSCFAVFTHVSL